MTEDTKVAIIHERRFMALYIADTIDDADFEIVANLPDLDGVAQIPSAPAPDLFILGAYSTALPALCKAIRLRFPSSKLVLVDAGKETDMGRIAREQGVDGCLSLDLAPELLLSGLRLVAAGSRCFPAVEQDDCQEPSGHPSVTLTPRERAVLALIGEGMANKVIARELSIAESTVKAHLNAVLRKTGTSNRTQAARWAFLNGEIV